MHHLFPGASRVVVFQSWCTSKRRSELNSIAMPQADLANAAVVPKHTVGGTKVLQHPISVLSSDFLNEGMNPTDAIDVCFQLTARITSNTNSAFVKLKSSFECLSFPKLNPAMTLCRLLPYGCNSEQAFCPGGLKDTVPSMVQGLAHLSRARLGRIFLRNR